jgi:hypothetical protein
MTSETLLLGLILVCCGLILIGLVILLVLAVRTWDKVSSGSVGGSTPPIPVPKGEPLVKE